MGRWVRLNTNMLGDPTIQRLSAAAFGAQFFAAIDSDDEDNLATACFSCNRSKRDKTVEEWLQ